MKLQLSPAEESSLKSIRLHLARPSPGTVSGTHRGVHSGRGIEFHEFRPYTPGEDLRHLDWRTAGRTGRYFIRRYDEERSLRALIFLDQSPSMRSVYPGAVRHSKLDAGQAFAFYLSRVFFHNQERIGLALGPGDLGVFLPPASGGESVDRIARLLEKKVSVEASKETNYETLVASLMEKLEEKTELYFISDFYAEPAALMKVFAPLRKARVGLYLVHVVDSNELSVAPPEDWKDRRLEFQDSESRLKELLEDPGFRKRYRELVEEHIAELGKVSRRSGLAHIPFLTGEPFFAQFLKRFSEHWS